MKLTIISHTEHYKQTDGTIVGLGSTVMEINHLLEIFDSIIHVAMLHSTDAPANTSPYNSKNITFIPLPALGGTQFSDKLKLLWAAPSVLRIVQKAISTSDYFQFRAPTGIGVYVIPYLVYVSKAQGWFKYAGNWNQKHAPWAYRFQKWLLIHQAHMVTINGNWPDQPSHVLSFENPCLTLEEFKEGHRTIALKNDLSQGVHLCFVGRLEEAKGLGHFIKALDLLKSTSNAKLQMVHIVGEGAGKETYIQQASNTGVPFKFYGLLERSKVHEVYRQSHVIILPSLSEGFPKVIAEAMNYGCLPIVSDVSSISQYIQDAHNGFLLQSNSPTNISKALIKFLELSATAYHRMVQLNASGMEKFTYSYYNTRIKSDIISKT